MGGLVTLLASPVVECICGQSDQSEEKESLLTSTFQGLPFISASSPPCQKKVRVINILPILGTKLEGLLLPASPVWSVNSSEFGFMRYLHSYSAADDAAKESFSGLVLRLKSCSGCFGFFFLYSIQEYAFMVCGLSILVQYKRQMHVAALLSSHMLIYIA